MSQCGFRKVYSSQHCLQAMLECLNNFKKSVEDGNESGALLTDLSKVLNCINHKLLIAKLFCGVSSTALNLIHSYLTNRTQRINNSFSRRSSIEYGVLQGSVLGSLFDIDLIDLFY